jgi:hypothetical protein
MNQNGGAIEDVFAGDDVVSGRESVRQGERGDVAGRECKGSLASLAMPELLPAARLGLSVRERKPLANCRLQPLKVVER